jgi:hypothetical protein
MLKKTAIGAIGQEHDVTNGAAATIKMSAPYVVQTELTGACDMLFHRYNAEAVKEKGEAGKGSAAKKTDNTESYVYRDDDGHICLPGNYVQSSMVHAAKYRQDPRSPRKSAMDLYKAGIVTLTPLGSLGTKKWEFEHSSRVLVQRSAITRVRPAFKVGWKVKLDFLVNLPEYISPQDFHDVLINAGRLVGVGDWRPTYGRFNVTSFKLLT